MREFKLARGGSAVTQASSHPRRSMSPIDAHVHVTGHYHWLHRIMNVLRARWFASRDHTRNA